MSPTRIIESLLSLITPLAVVVCAYFGARGVSEYIAARYVGEASAVERPVRRAPAVAPVKTASKDGDEFVDRNMFCSGCESSETEPALQVAAAGDVVPDTGLPLYLVSTAVSTDPNGSHATIVNTQSDRKGAFWMGQPVPGGGEIRSITGRWIDFVNPATNRVERLRLDRPAPETATAPSTAASTRSGRGRFGARGAASAELEAEIAAKVKKTGDNQWEVDRTIFDFLRSNPTAASGVRVMPSVKNGKPNGFRVARLSPRSPVSKIGVQRGDVITAVNNTQLTGPDTVLTMMTQLNTLNRVVVTVERRGQPVELTYLLR